MINLLAKFLCSFFEYHKESMVIVLEQIDILQDLLHDRISNEMFYNQSLIYVKNPEARQVFTQLRDDEMRAIVNLQQKIDRLQSSEGIISKLFPLKPRV